MSPLLYSLYTHDCNPSYPNNAIIKFADDTTLVGLNSGGDESAYRAEVHGLVTRCKDNNLTLNTAKTKELIIDFRKRGVDPPSAYQWGLCGEGSQLQILGNPHLGLAHMDRQHHGGGEESTTAPALSQTS